LSGFYEEGFEIRQNNLCNYHKISKYLIKIFYEENLKKKKE
jgi:hypothetical protein